MQGYINWIDGLNKVVKIIFCFITPFYLLYRIFKCVLAKDFGAKFIFMIIVGVFGIIAVVLDLINVIRNGVPASNWVEDKVIDVKAEDKKEEKKPESK